MGLGMGFCGYRADVTREVEATYGERAPLYTTKV